MKRSTESSSSRTVETVLLSVTLAGWTAAGLGQNGQVYFDNGTPSSFSPTATSGGAFFDGFTTPGSPTVLTDSINDYHGSLWGGPSPTTLFLLVADTLMDYSGILPGQYGTGGPGEYVDDTGVAYEPFGVAPGSIAFFKLEIWRGDAPSLAAAQAAGEPGAISPVFASQTGGAGFGPGLPAQLNGVPAVILTIPEPSLFALMGVSSLALLIVRRRKWSQRPGPI